MDPRAQERMENDRFAKYTGVELVEARPGYALARLEISEKHLNGVDFVQGGALFTLADFAFAAASNAAGFSTVGISCSIAFIKTPRGKTITAEAREVSTQNRVCQYLINIYDEDKTLSAQMMGTGYIKR